MEEKHGVKNAEHISGDIMTSDEEIGMAELLGPEVPIEEGKVLQAKVVADSPEGVLVDIGLKSEGLIPAQELEGEERPGMGDTVTVMLLRLHTDNGHPLVSRRAVREKEAWERLAVAHEQGQTVEGTIRKRIKGGFQVETDGIYAFLPASQLELKFVRDTDRYIGNKYQFLIADFNRNQKNIVLSRRKLLEIEYNQKKGEIMANLQPGQVIEGTVTSITNFGAFVDIGSGVEGLVHISDITWHRLEKVSDVLKAGQQVKVQVLKVDREKDKISLGMKQTTPRPWETAEQKYPAGTVLKGKITSITDFGLFVELEPGLEGLLHVSEVSWSEPKMNLAKSFNVGQEVEVKVISLDPSREKISLSMKRLESNPWEEIKQKYPRGSRVKGTVTNLTPFGAFVRLPEGVEGLLHVGDISWTKKVRHPQEVVQAGQEIEVTVLDVNPDSEKVSLSLKHLSDDPFRRFRVGSVVTGTVKRLEDFGAFVELEPEIEALLRLPEISQDRIGSPSDVLKIGDTVEAKVIKSDPHDHKIDISIRKLDQERERELMKKYVNKDERPTLGQVLEEELESRGEE